MGSSQSANVTEFFVCFHINTMLLKHFHNRALILITKRFMPYLQCFRLRCQVDLCSVSWNTDPNRQYIKVINELTRCRNSSITSANNNFFILGCAVAVLGGCLDGEEMCACIWHVPNVFQHCVMPHVIAKHLDVYHTLLMLASAHFSCQARSFQD